MRHGDSDAAFRLLQRRHALQGIAKHGWFLRVQAMNIARLRKRKRRLERPWTLETAEIAHMGQRAEIQIRQTARAAFEREVAAARAVKQAIKDIEARRQRYR
jgi:uncharacterized sporulation protein YeaH/YhbH (DUF444 family)